jgi:hypothetical protein
MGLSMGMIWLGALLVLGGVVVTAAKVLSLGRLSESRAPRAGMPGGTLEPQESSPGLRLKAIWPGLALAAFGTLLLLVGAVT